MLAPRPTRSVIEKPKRHPVWNETHWKEMQSNNGSLFEMTLTCKVIESNNGKWVYSTIFTFKVEICA